ncbi:MAG: asparagine synthase-related protein [Lysobacteraceae bacterium]
MGFDYLALVDCTARAPDVGAVTDRGPDSAGLRLVHSRGPLTVFASGALPTRALPCGGIVLGHLFNREGKAVGSLDHLPEATHPARLRAHIIERCWGDYLLLQPHHDRRHALTVTRSPAAAGGVPCVHSIRDGAGFLTSNIELAVRLGLYRRRVDWTAIAHRLRWPGIKSARTALAGIGELLPGCSLHIGADGVSEDAAWSPWTFVAPGARTLDPQEAADAIRGAVRSAVRAWLPLDRSILLELSGGLDSSIVAACLKDGPSRVTCCNLLTPPPGVDERHYAGLMADALGVPLHTHHLDKEQAEFRFPTPADSTAPTMGPLQYAIDVAMGALAERHGADSFHSGGGGDSVFCYLRTTAPAVDAARALRPAAAMAALRDLTRLHNCTLWTAGRLALAKLFRRPGPPARPDTRFLPGDAEPVPAFPHPWFGAPANAWPGDRERIFDLAGNQLFQGQAPRGSRRPLRFPLLAQPVMEACLRAPSWLWIAGGRNRALARRAFGDLPDEVRHRQSKATYIGFLGSVYTHKKTHILDLLADGCLDARGLIDIGAIRRFTARPLPPRDQTFLRLFELCMVENWLRHHA